MPTISGTFTATGVSNPISIGGGQIMTIALSGTWVGVVELQRLVGTGAWEPYARYTSNVSQVNRIKSAGDVFRWKCRSYTSGTVTYSLADSSTDTVPGLGEHARATESGFEITKLIGPTSINGVTTFNAAAIVPPVTLTDGASIVIDAALGNLFRVTLTGDAHTFAAPLNPVDGQIIAVQVVQGGSGGYGVAWNAAFQWTTSIPEYDFSADTTGKVSTAHFRYIGAGINKWRAIGVNADD